MGFDNVPTLDDFNKFAVNRTGSGALEVIQNSLYDFQDYGEAGVTQMLFFQVPAGQSSKTFADTNMESAGQLPNPKAFLITSIEILLFPGVTIDVATAAGSKFADDCYTILKSGWLELFIGSKTYLREAPLMQFPPAVRLYAAFGASDTTTAGAGQGFRQEYASGAGRPYVLKVPIGIPPTQNFNVSLNWPTAVPTISTAHSRIGVRLNGYLYRNSQ